MPIFKLELPVFYPQGQVVEFNYADTQACKEVRGVLKYQLRLDGEIEQSRSLPETILAFV